MARRGFAGQPEALEGAGRCPHGPGRQAGFAGARPGLRRGSEGGRNPRRRAFFRVGKAKNPTRAPRPITFLPRLRIRDRPGRINQCLHFGLPVDELRRRYLVQYLRPYDTAAVNLDHLVTVPSNGLGRRIATLDTRRMLEICRALEFALGCDPD